MSYQPYPQQPPSSNTFYPPQQPYQTGGFPSPPNQPYQPYPPQQPMYPPPPYQQPPKKKRGPLFWILIIGVCVVCIGIGSAISHTSTPVPTATPLVTSPAASTTHTSTPTQHRVTATHGTPRLGGLLSDFVGRYGQPNDHSDKTSYHFLRAANGPTDGLIAWSLNTARTNHVNDVTVAPTGTMQWTSSDAKAKCMTFAPADAHLKQRFDYADGKGYDLVYTSTQLAHDFPANEFTDASAVNQVRAGTFDVSYLYTSDGRHIDSCDMIIGEQQTSD